MSRAATGNDSEGGAARHAAGHEGEVSRAATAGAALKFTRAAARIDEDECIGCALCLAACPVDAIVGASQWMHGVLDELCIGCELCVPVCPVDCITMKPPPQTRQTPQQRKQHEQRRAREAGLRIKARKARLAREAERSDNTRRAAKEAFQKHLAARTQSVERQAGKQASCSLRADSRTLAARARSTDKQAGE